MVNKDDDLKLIYVLKIGYNTRGEGLYEFVFAEDETDINVADWLWDLTPASEHAEAPPPDFVDGLYHLKTKAFNLVCLHESYDRSYMHGYHGIIALAYEDIENEIESPDGFDQHDELFGDMEDDDPVVVFHYGNTLTQVKEILYQKKIILKGNEFIGSSSVNLN